MHRRCTCGSELSLCPFATLARARAMSLLVADDSEAWIQSTPPRVVSDRSPAVLLRRESNAQTISRCLPSLAIGSLGLVLIGVALRGGAPGVEAVRSWQDQAHNRTHCSPSSQAQARCAPAADSTHPAHPAHPSQAHSVRPSHLAHPAVQGGAGRPGLGGSKTNATRAEPPLRPAAALPRSPAAAMTRSAAAPPRPAAVLPRPAPRPAAAITLRPAAALPRAPKAGGDIRRTPKPRGSVRSA